MKRPAQEESNVLLNGMSEATHHHSPNCQHTKLSSRQALPLGLIAYETKGQTFGERDDDVSIAVPARVRTRAEKHDGLHAVSCWHRLHRRVEPEAKRAVRRWRACVTQLHQRVAGSTYESSHCHTGQNSGNASHAYAKGRWPVAAWGGWVVGWWATCRLGRLGGHAGRVGHEVGCRGENEGGTPCTHVIAEHDKRPCNKTNKTETGAQ